MTVLLWGQINDPVVGAIANECVRQKLEVIVADGDDILQMDIDNDLLTKDGTRVALDRITGIFVRPNARLISADSVAAFQMLTAWTELTPVPVLNRPSAAASNRSKPYQLRFIADAGFAVPDTLVTSDPEKVRAFWAEHGKIIYKSVSGVRSIVAILNSDDGDHIEDVSTCPTQFQKFIEGIDYRVHVVEDEVYPCRIESTAVDYRYPSEDQTTTVLYSTNIPEAAAERCVRLTKSLGLRLAGIDLRIDREGVEWCFEVNTAPGFIWFEQQTGQPITAAVARALSDRTRAALRGFDR
jgi:glutathione synthase/RimK-type ligase-like ATP-grasp enzyme